MRFAGQRVSNFTGGVTGVENYMQDSPDYGKNAQVASNIARQEEVNSIGKQSRTLNTGILSAADVEGAAITGAAERSLANAGVQASMIGAVGKIGGSIIGGINVGGGGSVGEGLNVDGISKYMGGVDGGGGDAAGYFNNYGDKRLVDWMN